MEEQKIVVLHGFTPEESLAAMRALKAALPAADAAFATTTRSALRDDSMTASSMLAASTCGPISDCIDRESSFHAWRLAPGRSRDPHGSVTAGSWVEPTTLPFS